MFLSHPGIEIRIGVKRGGEGRGSEFGVILTLSVLSQNGVFRVSFGF